MEIPYTIYPEQRYVHAVGNGKQTMEEMISVVDAVAEDPRFDSGYSMLFDLRKADYTAELRDGDDFVVALKRRIPDFQDKFALLVPEKLHVLAKLYSVLAAVGGFDRMKCFLDIDKAKAWCDIQD
ncbi:MAG: hypothetical protein KAU94_01125 [Verrucomicrobia bacterium]|nr:hypothetical protein [Verrucomicrobiota bacterium]